MARESFYGYDMPGELASEVLPCQVQEEDLQICLARSTTRQAQALTTEPEPTAYFGSAFGTAMRASPYFTDNSSRLQEQLREHTDELCQQFRDSFAECLAEARSRGPPARPPMQQAVFATDTVEQCSKQFGSLEDCRRRNSGNLALCTGQAIRHRECVLEATARVIKLRPT
eukprot:TRINITY_DN37806_c0_g1_i1.p1 TRINITY_DN37806_c0_g1~~TRINITY_DN37806_c0_g1_i1.p1  ORF type:complete len:171 (+),score=28.08 TRINITY_DN37806_c0_g1_i1:66-578(+)